MYDFNLYKKKFMEKMAKIFHTKNYQSSLDIAKNSKCPIPILPICLSTFRRF
jgi:hypothetical protein